MTVSLIIPTYRRPHHVGTLLESLLKQKYDSGIIEILVIGNLACRRTRQLCNDFKSRGLYLSYFETGKRGVNIARNYGLKISKGDICLFLDDDCILHHNQWIADLVLAFETQPSVDGIGGYYLINKNFNFWGLIYYIKLRAWLLYNNSESGAHRLLGGCMAFRKKTLGTITFNEEIIFGGAETDLVLRLIEKKFKLVLSESLSVTHSFKISFLSFVSKVYRQGQFHKNNSNFENQVMKQFIPKKPFSELQELVIAELRLSLIAKLFLPIGLKIHKIIFYWN